MNIQMLGTGSAFAKKYDNNNAMLEFDGYHLLIDCGITLPMALHKAGYSFNQLNAVLISHMHADHVGGLEEYAFQMMFLYGSKPVLYIAEGLVEPLWEQTLRGGLTQEPLNSLNDFFDVRPLKENLDYELYPGLKVKLIRTEHIEGKLSYSFIFNDSFFYSADMKFDGELLARLIDEGIQTIYHDCQLQAPGVVHACLDELLTLPDAVQAKVKLMHYGDNMEDYIGRTGQMSFVQQRQIVAL
ncbi:MBL fold metallo-hydrolase [Paenibacillus sp. NEAU-GSW1]|uniref:MBL fold metallo-hydrolase n=1 Tax=Paenibacillus sp. NEAU-GSW1 TaxID=2682486 RepID=UPI0012E1B885|nr:MBL fold metallo-hydrolase [Paenibacillus sp. NEAU-GSW1]MUT66143.1 MBL fold metallo-hydrolase [Paenibacillus sp. NEAU-GSW1]